MVTKEKLDSIASNIRQGYGFFKSCQMEGVTDYSEVGKALGARNKGKRRKAAVRKTENVVLKETWKKVEEKNKKSKSGQLEFDLGI